MEHNVKLCYDAIKSSKARNKVFEIGYTGGFCRVNNVAKFNLNGYSKYNLREDFRKAVNELRKEKDYENAHLICDTNNEGRLGIVVKVSLKDYKREKLAGGEQVYLVEEYDIYTCTEKLIYGMIKKYPKYELQLRSGFAFRGAQIRRHQTINDLEKELDWACTEDLKIDHGQRVILVNGFSENDMW